MIWEKVRGHSPLVIAFRRCLERSRLSHAYLFVGPAGIGKSLFARTLAQCLLCDRFPDTELETCGECSNCRQFEAGSHPDLHIVRLPKGKSEIPIELIAGDDDKRGREGLCFELSLRPMCGNRRIAIVEDAHLMNQSSSNALLKTLEEPPPQSLLILTASNLNDLLPTILSRCQILNFSPLAESDVSDLLMELEWCEDRGEAEVIADLSEGSLEIAQQLLDPEIRQMRDLVHQSLSERQHSTVNLSQSILKQVEAIGGDTPGQRMAAQWIARFCVEFYRQASRKLTGCDLIRQNGHIDRLNEYLKGSLDQQLETVGELLNRATEADQQLERRINTALVVESLFNDLAAITRQATAADR